MRRYPNDQIGAINTTALVGSVVALIVAGAIFILSTRTQIQPAATAPASVQNITDHKTTQQEIKWQQYSNTLYHLSFTYPANWKITEGLVGENKYLITMTDPTQLTNALLLVLQHTSIAEQAATFTSSPGITVIANGDTTVAGHPARLIRYKTPDGIVGRFYLVDANDTVYKLPTIYESGDPKPVWFMLTDISDKLFSSYNFDVK